MNKGGVKGERELSLVGSSTWVVQHGVYECQGEEAAGVVRPHREGVHDRVQEHRADHRDALPRHDRPSSFLQRTVHNTTHTETNWPVKLSGELYMYNYIQRQSWTD